MAEIDSLTAQLAGAKVEDEINDDNSLSFSDKGLTLTTEADAQPIVSGINDFKNMKCLYLNGNTIGPDAAKAIGKALSSHPEFQRARWKDIFTRRSKEDIPEALNYLGGGMMLAEARLVELDLSDNAFGPNGMEGLQELIRSPVCYGLKELRLNNNGLGIFGVRMLVDSLFQCLEASTKAGSPLALEVLICGRNRLENEGAKRMAEFFKACKTLQEVQMFQNGIYLPGITALADAFSYNPRLRILNLRDNTFTPKGARVMAKALPKLPNLEVLNFGDCLLKTKGGIHIAQGLKKGCPKLKEVILSYNEMTSKAGLEIAEMLASKPIKTVDLNGNQFGEKAIESIKQMLNKDVKFESFSDDEGSDEEEEGEESEGDGEGEEEQEDDSIVEVVNGHSEGTHAKNKTERIEQVSPEEFLKNPSRSRFLGLSKNPLEGLLKALKENQANGVNSHIEAFMNLSSLFGSSMDEPAQAARSCASSILIHTYSNYTAELVSNTLLVYLDLLKNEDKQFKCHWRLDGPLLSLETVVRNDIFPSSARNCLQVFLSRPNTRLEEDYPSGKHKLMQALFQY